MVALDGIRLDIHGKRIISDNHICSLSPSLASAHPCDKKTKRLVFVNEFDAVALVEVWIISGNAYIYYFCFLGNKMENFVHRLRRL